MMVALKLLLIFGVLAFLVVTHTMTRKEGSACISDFMEMYADDRNKNGVVKLCEFAKFFNKDELNIRFLLL